MAVILKKILVRRMVYTRIYNSLEIMQYIIACIGAGSGSDLYQNPNIATTVYDEGLDAADAIQNAVNKHTLKPTKGNFKAIKTSIISGKGWLNKYADSVEVIANADANRNTLEEASGNILHSFLSSRKVGKSKKGNPQKPVLTWKAIGEGNIDVEITNGKGFNATQTNFILVDSSMNATVSLMNGELIIESEKIGPIRFKSAYGKGRFVHFLRLKTGKDYDLYAYSQNGNSQFSELSTKRVVSL